MKRSTRQTNLQGESAEYLAKLEQLRCAEIELLNQREKVADLRRRLPQGPMVHDYELVEGRASLDAGDAPLKNVRLSQLYVTGPAARDLSAHVRQEANDAVPDVHGLGRRVQRRGTSPCAERRRGIWNILDLTPQGRGDWDASLAYGTRVSPARH